METDVHCYVRRERVRVPGEFDDFFDPKRTAIVEIDMHRGHLDEGPECTMPIPGGRAKIRTHNEFNAAARRLGVAVIHARVIYRNDGIDNFAGPKGPWPGMRISRFVYSQALKGMAGHNAEGSRLTEFVVDVEKGDYVVNYKKRYSAFFQTDLEFLLNRLAVETVVITGVATDVCDLNTAYDAVNRDYKVLIPRDVVAGFPDGEQAALDLLSLHVGLVVDWRELVAEWEARVDARVTAAHG